MITKPLVSIITINYKQAIVTNQLLVSLQELTYPAVEIIVVDNASGQSDVALLNTSYQNVQLICSDTNRGFSGGNNLGILEAKGEYIFLLNNDTEVVPDLLEEMLSLFEKNPTIGAVSPKIKYFYQPDTIQYAGYTAMNKLTLRMNAVGNKQIDSEIYKQERETHFAHGCAMMVAKKVIDQVGLMPEEYFLYYEELDWSSQIKNAGYKIYYQGRSVVFHKESVSVEKNSPLKTYYINRNRILYMRRNFGFLYKIIASLYILFVSIPKNVLTFLLKNEKEHLKAYRDAIVWNISPKTKNKWKS